MKIRPRPADCCEEARPVVPLSEDERTRMALRFRALGDPTRLEIFRLIAGQDAPICVCDITDRFEFSQPTISHHLKALREAELITVSRRGNWAFYVAEPAGLELLSAVGDPIIVPALAGIG